MPAPFGPMSPVIEPSPTESVQPASASTPPKRLVMLVTVRSSPVTGSPVPAALGTASPLGVQIDAYHTSGSGTPATRHGFVRVTTVGEVHRGNLCYGGSSVAHGSRATAKLADRYSRRFAE